MSEPRMATETERYGLGKGPISVERMISPEVFEEEREKIFRRAWLNVGREDQIPEPGDYFVKDLPILKTSIVVVRGTDGNVRAFHNMCRHRGNKVARACEGQSKGFRCNFHGWTYDLEGNLVTVPDEDQFFDFRREDNGLVPVAIDSWEGFLFVNAQPKASETLREFLGEMVDSLAGYPFAEMQRAVTYVTDVKANWKVFMDAFQEGYHVPFVHQYSLPEAFRSMDLSPFLHLPSLRLFRRHRGTSVPANPAYQPMRSEEAMLKMNPLLVQGSGVPPEAQPPGANPDKLSSWAFDINMFFPNFSIFVSGVWYLTYNFWPIAPDRTIWEVKQYLRPPKNAAERVCQEAVKIGLRDPIREDLSRLEDVQYMLGSGASREVVLSEQEIMVRHAYKVIDDHLRE